MVRWKLSCRRVCYDVPGGYHGVPWWLPRGLLWYLPPMACATAPPTACHVIIFHATVSRGGTMGCRVNAMVCQGQNQGNAMPRHATTSLNSVGLCCLTLRYDSSNSRKTSPSTCHSSCSGCRMCTPVQQDLLIKPNV